MTEVKRTNSCVLAQDVSAARKPKREREEKGLSALAQFQLHREPKSGERRDRADKKDKKDSVGKKAKRDRKARQLRGHHL